MSLQKKSHKTFYTLAERELVLAKNYEKALELYKLVPADHPMYVKAQRTIGYSILGRRLDNWEAAVPYVEEAYRMAPTDPKVLEDIGRVYLKTGRDSEGIKLLEKAGTGQARQALQTFRGE